MRKSKPVLARCSVCCKVATRMKQPRSGLACYKRGVYCGSMHVMEWL